MAIIPEELSSRLGAPVASRLDSTIDGIGSIIADVYKQCASEHAEHLGDNANVFGVRVWHRIWYRIERFSLTNDFAKVVSENSSHLLQLSPLTVGCYGLGASMFDDVTTRFPDDSPLKRSYGYRNSQQMSFFPSAASNPRPGFENLNHLTIGHFGNPRDGFCKWYVGAFTFDSESHPVWAWIKRQPLPRSAANDTRLLPSAVPFNDRTSADVTVRLRNGLTQARPER